MSSSATLGKYRLVRPIAQGGMAEIFLAKQEGIEGFSKNCVVKRVLPQFAKNEDFVSMFLDEARLAAQLSHPNVVQVFDFGQEDGTYYLAMEFLNGEDLAGVLRLLRKRGEDVPFDVAAAIIAEAAAGLHYAHTLLSDEGDSLNIVHRDISPSNVFMTYQGAVKVLDFGIAKAEGKEVQTATGVLKGKHIYMSPEQIRTDPLTGQSDVWALGVCLYELVTKKRPFARDNELAVLQAILEDDVPRPSTIRPDIPALLDDAIMRALTRDLNARFPSAQAFRDALCASAGSRVGADTIGSYMKYLFGEDAPKKKLAALKEPTSDDIATARLKSGPKVLSDTIATIEPRPTQKRSSKAALIGAAVAVLLGVAGVLALGGGDEGDLPPPEVTEEPAPTSTATELPPKDKPPVEDPSKEEPRVEEPSPDEPTAEEPRAEEPAAEEPADTKKATKTRKRRARRRATTTRRPAEDKPAVEIVEDKPKPAAAGSGTLSVNCIPWCKVFVDGKDTGKNSPLRGYKLGAGKHKLKVVNPPTGKTEERTVTVKAGENTVSVIRFP